MEIVFKNFFSYLAKSDFFRQKARTYGLKFGARRVVAGETIADAIHVVKSLNEQGFCCTIDHLGEFISSKEEAQEATEHCLEVLDNIFVAKVDCNLSLKLTQLGLDLGVDFCCANMEKILERAKEYDGIFVRVDMEDFEHCQKTIDLVKKLAEKYHNIGTAIQSYLKRSEQDVQDLLNVISNIRLMKGAYKESSQFAYQNKVAIDESFKKLIEVQLLNNRYPAVATHDEKIVEFTKELAGKNGYNKNHFEFQMLYGIQTGLQQRLVKEGYKVRIYVPYGVDWYGYFMRRLAERPANAIFVLKGLVAK